jgi:hypothetical protein
VLVFFCAFVFLGGTAHAKATPPGIAACRLMIKSEDQTVPTRVQTNRENSARAIFAKLKVKALKRLARNGLHSDLMDYCNSHYSARQIGTVVTTTTTTTTTTLPPQPAVYDGSGDDVVQITKPTQAAVLYATYSGDANFIVTGLDANQQRVDGLINVIGAYTGTVPLDFKDGQNTTFLQVQSSGPWHFEVRPLRSIASFSGTGSGSGDDVVNYTGQTGIATINYTGDANFIVREYSTATGQINLLVNTIGAYSGRVPITGGSGVNIIEVKSSGTWTITVS